MVNYITKIIKICDGPDCDNIIEIFPYQIRSQKHHFCSKKCSSAWMSERFTLNNPMKNPDVRVKSGKSRSGINHYMHNNPEGRANHKVAHNTPEYLKNCPLRRPEVVEKVVTIMINNNPMKDPEIAAKSSRNRCKENNSWRLPEVRNKVSGINHYMHNNPEGRANHKAACNTPEHILSISGKNSPNYGVAPSPKSSHGKSSYYYHPDGRRIWLRSSYDRRVALALTSLNELWYYECDRFPIGELGTYRPDFLLPKHDLWLEIKGYMREEAQLKLMKFYELYPEINLRILYNEDIQKIEEFSHSNIPINYNAIGISLHDQMTEWMQEYFVI